MRLLLTCAALALVAGAAGAEDKPSDTKGRGQNAPVADTHVQEGAAKVTLESLKDQLTKMGFAPKVEGEFVNIDVKKEDYESYLYFSVDEHQVWVQSTLGSGITNLDAVPAIAYWKLLEANGNIAPAHFALDGDAKDLSIFQSLSKYQVPPAELKQTIETFHKSIQSTDALWRDPFKGKEEKEESK